MLRPHSALRHMRRLATANARADTNFYTASLSRADELRLCVQMLRCPDTDVDAVFTELASDRALTRELQGRYARFRPERTYGLSTDRFRVLYAAVRLRRPALVVETGVHDGLSTALMLRAMERNEQGRLISIDLPSTELPLGVSGAGWLVPDALKSRWQLRVGDAREHLGPLLQEQHPVDIFVHDSDHAVAHQRFELETVKPYMSPSGLIFSDHDYAAEGVLDELAASWSAEHFPITVRAGWGSQVWVRGIGGIHLT